MNAITLKIPLLAPVKEEIRISRFSKKQIQQIVIVIAVVMLCILGVVWNMSYNLIRLPPNSYPEIRYSQVPLSNEAIKVMQKADAPRKVEDARLKAKKDAATRREAEATKVKQEADVRRKAENAILIADKETAVFREAEAKKTLNIGHEYGGGKIAWLDATGQHGLIAAKTDIPGPYYTIGRCESKMRCSR